ncbi:MAG: hypothetical protein Q4C04_08295 [Clostridia bacterium]|nr:hypothetical protein [Clostridia bacterium]
MKKHLSLVLLSILFIFLDTAFFSTVNIYGIRPYMTLALALAATYTFSVQSGMIIAAVAGILIDLICNPYLGLTPALYIAGVIVLYGLIRRGHPKKIVVFLYYVGVCAALDLLLCLLSNIFGANRNIVEALLLHSLPCAALSSVATLGLGRLFKPLLKGQLESA